MLCFAVRRTGRRPLLRQWSGGDSIACTRVDQRHGPRLCPEATGGKHDRQCCASLHDRREDCCFSLSLATVTACSARGNQHDGPRLCPEATGGNQDTQCCALLYDGREDDICTPSLVRCKSSLHSVDVVSFTFGVWIPFTPFPYYPC